MGQRLILLLQVLNVNITIQSHVSQFDIATIKDKNVYIELTAHNAFRE
jgi:hypothetical protein